GLGGGDRAEFAAKSPPPRPSPLKGEGVAAVVDWGSEQPIAWAGTVCHHTDVGGRVPGSNASDSTEIYQEGLRIPPLKLYDRGERNETLFALIEKNVRVPVKVFGDLRAQLAACHIAEQALIELAGHYGVEKLARYMTEL